MENSERQALDNFRRKLRDVESEVRAIDRDLTGPDFVALAQRGRNTVRQTRDLLDKNVEILFAEQPRLHEDLYALLQYAEDRIVRAISTETDTHVIERQLILATRLTADVLGRIAGAFGTMEQRLDGGGTP